MSLTDVYLGIGSNRGDSRVILDQTLQLLAGLEGVHKVRCSRLYLTKPVGVPDVQRDYLNAACHLKTSLTAHRLHAQIKKIECHLGREPKPVRNASRTIDLDILFFGKEKHETPELTVPHPRWRQRLFVVAPLADLVTRLATPDGDIHLQEILNTFPKLPNEMVRLLT